MSAVVSLKFYQEGFVTRPAAARCAEANDNETAKSLPESYGGLLEGVGPTASELTVRRLLGDGIVRCLRWVTVRR